MLLLTYVVDSEHGISPKTNAASYKSTTKMTDERMDEKNAYSCLFVQGEI